MAQAVFKAAADPNVFPDQIRAGLKPWTPLKDYARVADILSSAGGVRGVLLAEAAGTHATFTVLARGGADALFGSLATNASFERIEPKAGGTIAFRFHP